MEKTFFHWNNNGTGRGVTVDDKELPDPSWVRYGQMLVVCGRPGVGKTRLAERMKRSAEGKTFSTLTVDGNNLIDLLNYWSKDMDDMDPVSEMIAVDLLVIDAWSDSTRRLDKVKGFLELLVLRKDRSQIITTQVGDDYWTKERSRLKSESKPFAGFSDSMQIIRIDEGPWQLPKLEDDIPF